MVFFFFPFPLAQATTLFLVCFTRVEDIGAAG